MMTLSKLSQLLLHTARQNPSEFCDRVSMVLEVKWDRIRNLSGSYTPTMPRQALETLERTLGKEIGPFLAESNLTQIEEAVSDSQALLKAKAPFTLAHNGDIELARFCYALSRALAPKVVLETGVAYGVTTAFILKAIEVNGTGELWSADLPPLGRQAEDYVGFLVPKDLRLHWNLRRGITKRLLPELLPSLGHVDIFIQDSLHTYRNINDEVQMVWPFLKPGGVVIVDDIGGNCAFEDLIKRVGPSSSIVIQELHKKSMFGVLVKDGGR
jgi:Methyltransferase domain